MILNRLEKLKSKMIDNSLFFLVSKNPNCCGDDKYFDKFDKNIFYFTNLIEDNLIVCFEKKNKKIKKYLFIEKQSKSDEIFNGKIDKSKIIKNSIFLQDEVFFNIDIFKVINFNIKNIYFFKNDFSKENFENQNKFVKKVKTKYKNINYLNSFEIVKNLREIKDSEEIKNIKKAISITKKANDFISKNIKKYKCESEIFRDLNYILNDNKTYFSFKPIIANSKNSTTLHYNKNLDKIKKDDSILVDFGCEVFGYQSDITRTFVKTHFQKKVYLSVLKAQKKIIQKLKEGESFKNLQILSENLIKNELIKVGLIEKKYIDVNVRDDLVLLKKLRSFYPHSFSHHLGLDTHDLGNYDELKENMVITIELGIYIKNKFGIRIEDNILIKKDSCINLSKNIKK